MKKAGFVLFTVVFFLMCALPVLAIPLAQSRPGADKLPPLPGLYTAEAGVNNAFGEEMERYLTEHFAGRDALVTANAKLTKAVFATSAERQVILGREGWLFYSATLQDYLGTHPLTERELADITRTMALVQEYANGLGSDFVFAVAPNKNSLYGQYMPYYTVSAGGQDDLAALARALGEEDVAYLDLYALLAGRPGLYHKRDTHWNNAGALLACNALLDRLGHPHNSFSSSGITTELSWRGDLDRLLFPVNGVLDEQVIYQPGPEAYYEYQGPARLDISRVVTQSDSGTGSLLCFRDSFGNAAIPFLAAAYADATFLSATPHTPDLLEPGQTLVIEIVQRNLRVLLQAAPRMPAPARALPQPPRRVAGGAFAASEEAGDYLQVYGSIDDALAEGAQALCVAVEAEGETVFYEAFPALEGKLPDEEKTGRGFSLYIPLEQLPPDGYRVYPAVQYADEAIIITE